MKDEAPENGEWHEFTHHHYDTFEAQGQKRARLTPSVTANRAQG